MKRIQSYRVLGLTSLLSLIFSLSSCSSEEKKGEHPAENRGVTAEENALRQTTKGDQTDIYAIPLDEDQLGQQEELEKFEAESKAYREKEREEAAKSKTPDQ